ncbi:DUF3995 domain-containing protein [Runella aurantiaca]|uniref:DUF3995 domain-containing protein n=2 Tax=Runella aurantiaca TaxID=2282308 RepID=A0A369I6E9_9BACT|nr:DUF3995 domain-containing protein [Runella aurantiaca]
MFNSMKPILALIDILIFAFIASVHFYWAFGGRRLSTLAVPTSNGSQQKPLFTPGPLSTMAVGIGLLCFAWILAVKAGFINSSLLSDSVITYISIGIAIIFFLRAIGEFKYVGFFKKIKQTEFGQMDTRYYSPLCLLISFIILVINYY